MIETWNTNRNMVMYRLYGVQYLLEAKRLDNRINVSTALPEFWWCSDTRDYLVHHGTGLGPFLGEVDKMLDKIYKMLPLD